MGCEVAQRYFAEGQKYFHQTTVTKGQKRSAYAVWIPSVHFWHLGALSVQRAGIGNTLQLQKTYQDLWFQLDFQTSKGQLQSCLADLPLNYNSFRCSSRSSVQKNRSFKEKVWTNWERLHKENDRNVKKPLQITFDRRKGRLAAAFVQGLGRNAQLHENRQRLPIFVQQLRPKIEKESVKRGFVGLQLAQAEARSKTRTRQQIWDGLKFAGAGTVAIEGQTEEGKKDRLHLILAHC